MVRRVNDRQLSGSRIESGHSGFVGETVSGTEILEMEGVSHPYRRAKLACPA